MAYSEVLYNEVVSLIGLKHENIQKNTAINIDLEIHGDDACFFFEKIVDKFKVKNLDKLDFNKFFLPELGIKYLYLRIFKPKQLEKMKDKVPLTVNHLVKVVERGEWFDPE